MVYSVIDGAVRIAGRNNSNTNHRHKIRRNHDRNQGHSRQGLLIFGYDCYIENYRIKKFYFV